MPLLTWVLLAKAKPRIRAAATFAAVLLSLPAGSELGYLAIGERNPHEMLYLGVAWAIVAAATSIQLVVEMLRR